MIMKPSEAQELVVFERPQKRVRLHRDASGLEQYIRYNPSLYDTTLFLVEKSFWQFSINNFKKKTGKVVLASSLKSSNKNRNSHAFLLTTMYTQRYLLEYSMPLIPHHAVQNHVLQPETTVWIPLFPFACDSGFLC